MLCGVAYLCTIAGMGNLEKWIMQVTNDASWRAIAETLGTTHSTIRRRLHSDPANVVLEVARMYDANPVYGLLCAECITRYDLREYHKVADLSEFDDLELANEIVRRLQARQDSENTALDLEIYPDTSNVHFLHDMPPGAVADRSTYHAEENTDFDD